MTALGVSVNSFNTGISSGHFSNDQLQELYRLFTLGNILDNPYDILTLAEYIYEYDTFEQLKNDDKNKLYFQDGIGIVFKRAFEMRETV